jgi:hypothetical protein
MAFDNTGLNLLSVGNPGAGPRIWGYNSSDAIATIVAVNYFRAQTAGGLRAGDIVVAKGSDGTTIVNLTTVTSSVSTGTKMSTTAIA